MRESKPMGRRAPARRSVYVLAALALITGGPSAGAQAATAPRHTLMGPGLHLLSVARGNLLVRIGAKESFVAGAQRPELVAAARALLASEHAPPVRFALAMASEDATREGVLMLGADFASDGYPDLDVAAGGSFDGLVKTIDTFTRNFGATNVQFVPMRGPATNGAALRAYRDMLVAVRDRVAKLVAGGASERDVVAAKPTAAFDARWGHGPVSGDQFAAMAFRSLARH
jgi:hypothetical protein